MTGWVVLLGKVGCKIRPSADHCLFLRVALRKLNVMLITVTPTVTDTPVNRRGIPIASAQCTPGDTTGTPNMAPPSPTKSLERRPPLGRSMAVECLRTAEERELQEQSFIANDARTGYATNLKLLAENLVNDVGCVLVFCFSGITSFVDVLYNL